MLANTYKAVAPCGCVLGVVDANRTSSRELARLFKIWREAGMRIERGESQSFIRLGHTCCLPKKEVDRGE